jgi:predicted secreted protein
MDSSYANYPATQKRWELTPAHGFQLHKLSCNTEEVETYTCSRIPVTQTILPHRRSGNLHLLMDSSYANYPATQKRWELTLAHGFQLHKLSRHTEEVGTYTCSWIPVTQTILPHRRGGHLHLLMDSSYTNYPATQKRWELTPAHGFK